MSIISTVDLLKRVPLLADVSENDLEALAKHTRKVQFRKGELVLRRGEKPVGLYIVLTGTAQESAAGLRDEEREVILDKVSSMGAHIGEVSLLSNAPNPTTVVAVTNIHAFLIPKDCFDSVVSESPGLAAAMMQALVRRLRCAQTHIASLALYSVGDRVQRMLVSMSVPGPDVEGTRLIPGNVSVQEIALRVGASREAVSRELKDLRSSGDVSDSPAGMHLSARISKSGLVADLELAN